MKRIITLIIGFIMMFLLVGCGSRTNNTTPSTDNTPSTTIPSDTTSSDTTPMVDDELMNKTLVFKIGSTEVDVYWLSNNSIKGLKKLVKDGLTISMHKYSDFEQVGSIGNTLTSSDTRITTILGDICLYQSNQLVVFYGSNTWEYTKLGHINLTKAKLVDLLSDEDVSITINLK